MPALDAGLSLADAIKVELGAVSVHLGPFGPGRPAEQHPRCPPNLRRWLEREVALLGEAPEDDLARAALDDAQFWGYDEQTLAQWPDLVRLKDPDLPALKEDLLPGWAGTFAGALARSLEVPIELAVGLVLGVCGTVAARRLRLRVREGYYEPLNPWIVVALPPGNRKSAALAAAVRPLREWEAAQAKEMGPTIAKARSTAENCRATITHKRGELVRAKDDTTRGTLAGELATLEEEVGKEMPRAPQLSTGDVTVERLGTLLAEHGERMALISAEPEIFEMAKGRYSKGVPNLDLLLMAWSGDAVRVDRIGRPPVDLRNPLLTLCLCSQPDALRGLSTVPGFRGRGLLARFLYFLPRSPLGSRTLTPAPIPADVAKTYADRLTTMLGWAPEKDADGREVPHTLTLSPEARAEWLAFALAIEARMLPGGDLADLTDLGGKLPGQAARFAGILHAVEHADALPWEVDVSLQTMEQALDLAAVAGEHSVAALGLMGADPGLSAAEHVWLWLEGRRQSRVTLRDMWQHLRRSYPRASDLRAALAILEERGFLQVDHPVQHRPGRPPSPVVSIRPDLCAGWST